MIWAKFGIIKRKTVCNPHEYAGVDPTLMDILMQHHSVVTTIDIVFVNNIPFIITTSSNHCFGAGEALPNRQIGANV